MFPHIIVPHIIGLEGSDGKYNYSSVLSITSRMDGCVFLTPCPSHFAPG